MNEVKTRKKLIEVALPLEAINDASIRESYIYRGNPSSLHKWWAQRPLAAARAVIFAQMVDDPSAREDAFPSQAAQEVERQRLFRIIEDLVTWEGMKNPEVLARARHEIVESWRRACVDNAGHPAASQMFDPRALPTFLDPFAGGGTLPLEGQRLGLKCRASDLNPVAALINTAVLDHALRFAGRAPVNPKWQAKGKHEKAMVTWTGAQGLADDTVFYGKWILEEARKRIGQHYPEVDITSAIVQECPDLEDRRGERLSVIAWLWVRTVKSPNPAFSGVDVPLASTFILSSKAGREVYAEPIIENGGYRFEVRYGTPPRDSQIPSGTKLTRANFVCLMSGTPISGSYIKAEGVAGRLGSRLLAAVVENGRRRTYLSPTPAMEEAAQRARPHWTPEGSLPHDARAFTPTLYGLTEWRSLFTNRQLAALTTLSDLVVEVHGRILGDAQRGAAQKSMGSSEVEPESAGAYANAVTALLAFAVDKTAEYGCTLVPWYTKEDRPKGLFARQAIPMVWDYAEVNPFSGIGGSFDASVEIVAASLGGCCHTGSIAEVALEDAAAVGGRSFVISTDPPYYDNVPYADLSDFFYVWLRHSLRIRFPGFFATVAAPKASELVAAPYRHGGRSEAEAFFLSGMTAAMTRLAGCAHPCFPVTVYYAFKQSEEDKDGTAGVASTGWDTFLEAVIRAGFAIHGTWPMRTERSARSRGLGSNALASSVVLVCRRRSSDAIVATRRDLIAALKAELPTALSYLQSGNTAPVDLAQAAIGPGMAVYTRYARVLDADGRAVTVREALALINQTLDEAIAEQEGGFDADTRWAVAWFDQCGFDEGEFGVADVLARAKNTSVRGLEGAGLLATARGKVRLLAPKDLTADWDPTLDTRLTAWEAVHHLIRVLDAGGEPAAAALVQKLGKHADIARELAYRLYTLCERKKWAAEAKAYNNLVVSWSRIESHAAADALPPSPKPRQQNLPGT